MPSLRIAQIRLSTHGCLRAAWLSGTRSITRPRGSLGLLSPRACSRPLLVVPNTTCTLLWGSRMMRCTAAARGGRESGSRHNLCTPNQARPNSLPLVQVFPNSTIIFGGRSLCSKKAGASAALLLSRLLEESSWFQSAAAAGSAPRAAALLSSSGLRTTRRKSDKPPRRRGHTHTPQGCCCCAAACVRSHDDSELLCRGGSVGGRALRSRPIFRPWWW